MYVRIVRKKLDMFPNSSFVHCMMAPYSGSGLLPIESRYIGEVCSVGLQPMYPWIA